MWSYQFRVPNAQSDFEIQLVHLDNFFFFQAAYDLSSLVLFFIFTD